MFIKQKFDTLKQECANTTYLGLFSCIVKDYLQVKNTGGLSVLPGETVSSSSSLHFKCKIPHSHGSYLFISFLLGDKLLAFFTYDFIPK